MYTNITRTIKVLRFLRDNTLNILPFIAVILMATGHILSSVLTCLFIVYFIACQFNDLWFYRFFRKWGYDAFFLQYYDAVICGTNVGRELVEYRLLHRSDYVLMGYKMFREYCIEMDQLDKKIEENEIDYMYKNCYN